MNKDYQLYHLSHYENREDIVKTLLDRITALESEVNQLRQENMVLKNKYVSSLKNAINEKANPFSVSLQMNEPNCVGGGMVNQKKKKRKATSFYNYNCNKDISFKKGNNNKLNHSQANISMYLPTDNNEIEGDDCICNNKNSNSNSNNNKVCVSTIKKKKKALSLSQSTLRVSPEVNEAKIDTSYLVTESEVNNNNNNNNSHYKDNGIRNDLKQKQLRFNSKNHHNSTSAYNTNTNSNTNIFNGNTNSNTNTTTKVPYSKDNRNLIIDYSKTRNTKNVIRITKANANGNTNTNTNTNNTRLVTNTTANANANANINERYQSNTSISNNINSYNTNTNSKHNSSLLSDVYSKKALVSSDKKETGRELKEKKNQLIQIHRKLFSKSPLLKNYL